MKKLFYLSASVFLLSQAAVADTTQIVETFGQPSGLASPEVSFDGKYLAAECSPMQEPAICIYSLTTNENPKLFQVPDQARLTGFGWYGPGHLLISLNIFDTIGTSSGLKEYRFDRTLSYDVNTGQSNFVMKREARYNTGAPGVVAILPDQPDKVLTIWYANNLYEVDLKTGEGRRKDDIRSDAIGAFFTVDGDMVATTYWDRDSGLFRLRDADYDILVETLNKDDLPYHVWGFNADKSALLAYTDTDADYGLKEISLADGSVRDVTLNDEPVGDAGAVVDYFTNVLIGMDYTDDLYEQTFVDERFKAAHDELKTVFPDQTVVITSWTQNYDLMTLAVRSAGKPTDYYLYDTKVPSVSPIGNQMPHLQNTVLGSVEAVSYQAEDGLTIPAYLTLPPGKTRADGPFPLILLPHGGPEARDTAGFDWWSQAYAAAGYAVLQPNFRGSTGYGQEFRNRGYGEFGGKMITDTLDGGRWAQSEGIATTDGFCVIGGSYGGYAALQSAVLASDEMNCAISVNGVSNPITLIGDYFSQGTGFAYWKDYMGVTRFSDDAALAEITPEKQIDKLRTPILLIHGRQDTTVKYGQSQYLARLLEHRDDVKFVTMESEDHYLASTSARQTVLRESLEFLARYHPVN